MKKNEKPSDNLKMAAGLVASAAVATVAAMAYKVNEEKINAGVDKAAEGTKKFVEKASKKLKEVADDFVSKVDDEPAEATDIVEVDEVEVVEAEPAPATETEPVKESEEAAE